MHQTAALHWALHGNAFNPDTGELAKYAKLSRSSNGHLWHAPNTAEIHCLAQGTTSIPGTNTMQFIHVNQLPAGIKATYLCVVCAYQPEKTAPHHVFWMVGSNHVNYTNNVSTKTTDLSTIKILFNSVISTLTARCMMGNLKDFYHGTPMEPKDYAYMHILLHMLPDDIIEHYGLKPLIHNGHVYVEIQHGMYGLPQASLLANLQLQHFLEPHGYAPCTIMPSLWCHHT